MSAELISFRLFSGRWRLSSMRVGLIGKRELNRLNVLARLSSKTDRCSCGRRSSNIRWSDDVHDQATVLVRNVPRPSIFTVGPSSAGCRASSSPEPAYGHGDDESYDEGGAKPGRNPHHPSIRTQRRPRLRELSRPCVAQSFHRPSRQQHVPRTWSGYPLIPRRSDARCRRMSYERHSFG